MPLPNKAGEPEFKMKVEPHDKLVIKYKMNEEVVVSVSMTNTTKDRQCFKVKCTDNDIFRVRPPLGFIKPGETTVVKISLKPKTGLDPNRHFFAIYHVSSPDGKNNPRTVWNADTKADGVIRMQAVLLDVDKKEEDEKKEDEKEEEKKDDKKEEKKEEKKDEGGHEKKKEEKKE